MIEGLNLVKEFTDGEYCYMITDEDAMNKKLRIVTKLEGVLDEICEFIISEVNTKFYFDKEMNLIDEVSERTRFALLDTGLLKGDMPVFMIMNQFGGIFFGCGLNIGGLTPPIEALKTIRPYEVAEEKWKFSEVNMRRRSKNDQRCIWTWMS